MNWFFHILNQIKTILTLLVFLVAMSAFAYATDYEIGVYYFPGWHSKSQYWNDLKGLEVSRSPGRPWPDREPLLSWYPEEEQWVADTHLAWLYNFGIDFVAYDWYWGGKRAAMDHAINNYLNSPLRDKVRFSLLWANHSEIPRNRKEFEDMITYWLDNYFNRPGYYRIYGKPLVFIFSYSRLEQNAKRFGETGKSLLERANKMAVEMGYREIFFVATTNEVPSTELEKKLLSMGYGAYTGWNYVISKDKSRVADYDSMVDTFLFCYDAASKTEKRLPYIVIASPGWDSRPWYGDKAIVRENQSPEKFSRMLIGARKLLDSQSRGPRVLMIEAWNEFGEGSYIEPTKNWGMRYLGSIKEVFGEE